MSTPNSKQWPEPPAERQARKRIVRQKRKHRQPEEIDTRSPSGKNRLPY